MLQIISFPLERIELFWQGQGHISLFTDTAGESCHGSLLTFCFFQKSLWGSAWLANSGLYQSHGISIMNLSIGLALRKETPESSFPPCKRTFFLVTHFESGGKYSCWPSNSHMRETTQETGEQQLAVPQTVLHQLFVIVSYNSLGRFHSVLEKWSHARTKPTTSSKSGILEADTISSTSVNFHRNSTKHTGLCA